MTTMALPAPLVPPTAQLPVAPLPASPEDSAPAWAAATGVPDLFASVPATLFLPLGAEYRSLYWGALARFYRYEFEEPTNGLVRATAWELAEEVLRSAPEWREGRAALVGALAPDELHEMMTSEEQQLRATARRLVDRLERAGWFHFEYRSQLGEVLNFYPYAARILDPLLRIARQEEPVLQNYAYAIQHALRAESVAARPGWALEEARRKAAEFVRELKVLNRNIYDHTRRLLQEATTAAGVLEDLMGRYQRRVMGSFHKLKTVDNPFRHRGEIFARLDAFERDELLLDRAARWHQEQYDTDPASARAAVGHALRTVRQQLETLPALLVDIDARNSRFSGVARNRLLYLLSRNRHVDGQLQGVIDAMVAGTAPEFALDLYHCRLLGDDFLYVPRQQRTPREATPLDVVTATDPAVLQEKAQRLMNQPFGERAIRRYVDAALAGRDRMSAEELPLASDDDYVRYVCVIAHGLAAGAPYRFAAAGCDKAPLDAPVCPDPRCETCRVERNGYRVPRGLIERPTRRTKSPRRPGKEGGP
jgi:hypothetical protein